MLDRGSIPNRLEEAVVIEPPDPVERGKLHVFEASPGPAAVNHLRLEKTDDGFSQRIVVAVALASHRGLDACLGQPPGVANRKVLDPTIAVMHQPLSSLLLPLAAGLFQGIEGEIAAERGRDTPAHDAATERIDHKGHVDEATPCGHIGEIRDPQSYCQMLWIEGDQAASFRTS